jgi:hypothetical protein
VFNLQTPRQVLAEMAEQINAPGYKGGYGHKRRLKEMREYLEKKGVLDKWMASSSIDAELREARAAVKKPRQKTMEELVKEVEAEVARMQ